MGARPATAEEGVGGLALVQLLEANHLATVLVAAREARGSLGTDERTAVEAGVRAEAASAE